MEFNFSPIRVIVLVCLLAAFAVAGGFSQPRLPPDSVLDPQRLTKAWAACVFLFLAGAGCATVVDHFVGTLDRSNLRWLYVLLGVGLMIGSFGYLHGLRSAG